MRFISDSALDTGREAQVEIDLAAAGNHVQRAGAGVHVRNLKRRRREKFVAVVPALCCQLGQRRRHLVHRIANQFRIGDVALNAGDDAICPTAIRVARS